VIEVRFSRHAKRRAQLYGIPENAILDIITGQVFPQGTTELVVEMKQLTYPLKIVVSREQNKLTVITNYPLKKGKIQ
jgi:hypothetical protein